MLNKIPPEIFLNIFKFMDVNELFEKRKLCKYFKELVDNNLKYFYNNFSTLYPKSFCKIKNKVIIDNFIKGWTYNYIESLSKHDFTPFYIKKMKNDNITIKQAKLIFNLYKNYNIPYYQGIKCINFNSQQIEQIIKLKDIGIPDFFCITYSEHIIYSEKQFNILKKLKQLGVSEFYSNHIVLTFNDQKLEYFYSLVNSNIWFVNAYHATEVKIF